MPVLRRSQLEQVKQMIAKYPNDVKLVFKQFPLDTHSQASIAAEAALAAQAQGKFGEMHDKLYANFRSPCRCKLRFWRGRKTSASICRRFTADLDSHKYTAARRDPGEKSSRAKRPTSW